MIVYAQKMSGAKLNTAGEGGGQKPASGIVRTAVSPRTYFGPTRGAI